MKRPQNTGNFLFSWGLNLIMNYELAVLAIIIFIVRIFVPDIPLAVPVGILVFWLVLFFVITLVLTFLIKDVPDDGTSTGRPGTIQPKFSSSGKYRPEQQNAASSQSADVPVSFAQENAEADKGQEDQHVDEIR